MGKEDDWNSNFLQFSMYMHNLLFWDVCFCVSNKCQPDRSHFLCGTSHDPWKGFWMLKITKIAKMRKNIIKSANLLFLLLLITYIVQGEA